MLLHRSDQNLLRHIQIGILERPNDRDGLLRRVHRLIEQGFVFVQLISRLVANGGDLSADQLAAALWILATTP